MRFLPFILWIMTYQLFAAEGVLFRNDREGKSFYSSSKDTQAITETLKLVDSSHILRSFSETVDTLDPKKLCSFDLNKSLRNKLREINPNMKKLKGVILYLRDQNKIDDFVTRLLLDADRTISTDIDLPKFQEELKLPDSKTMEYVLSLTAKFKKSLKENCLDEAYFNFYQESLKFNKDIKIDHFEAIFTEAIKRKTIDQETFFLLEKARINNLEATKTSLKTYYKKYVSLRNQYPLTNSQEMSSFVTEEFQNTNMSRRQRLLNDYSDLQIIIMANIIVKLRSRLESPKAEILIYDRENKSEVITLDPMERFRLAIKLLRKEMSLLKINSFFYGRSPDYLDIMTAAFETGIIPAPELQEVSGLEDIWNPKKTFWQKSQSWVKSLSGVLTIAIPPPYGFIPALALVVIEMTSMKKNNSNDPTVIF